MAVNQLKRMLWLVDTVYRVGHISFAEINRRWRNGDKERMDIPLRTFHNHRNAIEEIFGINIECDKSSNEYYIEDAEDLYNDKFKKWLLDSVSFNNLIQGNLKLRERILFEDIPSGIQFMESIVSAMDKACRIKILYQAYNWHNSHELIVEPYFLRLFKQRWYLIGVNVFHNEIRIFALDRMKYVEILNDKFEYPKSLIPKDFFKDYFGIITGTQNDPQRTLLKVFAEQISYIRNLPLHPSQIEIVKTDSYSIFEYNIGHTYDFIQELLSKGSSIEVIEPESLKNRIIQELEITLSRYKQKSNTN